MSNTPIAGAARVHEQGYRRYDGVRLGPRHAIRSVVLHTLRFILGFRRKFRSKVLPIGILAMATLPALGFSAALLILPDFAAEVAQEVLPGPELYLGGTIFLVYIASAVAGPAALCGDRLHGALALYLASRLTRRTYLLGKALAVFGLLATITIVPSLVYVLGVAVSGVADRSAADVLTDVAQVLAAGTLAAAAYSALSMAAASLTDRQGAASGLIIGYAMVSSTVRGVLTEALGLPESFALLDINAAVAGASFHLHGEGASMAGAPGVIVSLLAALAWTAALGAVVVVRYDRLQVTR